MRCVCRRIIDCMYASCRLRSIIRFLPDILKSSRLSCCICAALEAMQHKKEQHGKKCGQLSEELLVSGDRNTACRAG